MTKIIEIPFHPEEPRECFGNILDMLSHSIEACWVVGSDKPEFNEELDNLAALLSKAFHYGEELEIKIFKTPTLRVVK